MIKKILLLTLCLNLFETQADAPGKRSMFESKVTFKNIPRQGDYIFYWKGRYDSAHAFTIDSTFIIPGSGGAPMDGSFWGVNKNTNQSTDTLFFSNYYAPDFIIKLDTISNSKLLYSKEQVSNSNNGSYNGDNDYSKDEGTNRSTKIILFSSISLIALILLIWYFIRRKSKP